MNMFDSALLAAQDIETIANVIDWTALEEWRAQRTAVAAAMDEFVKEREAVADAIDEHARQWPAIMEVAKTFCPSYEEIATLTAPPAPPRLEFSVPEAFYPAMAWTPTFEDEPDFEVKPNRRSIVRPEVTTRIGFHP